MQVSDGTELSGGIVVPKYYKAGLGYSPASGPQVGGLGVGANPREYSSTFFGSDVKNLLPPTLAFGSKKSKRRSRKSVKKPKKSRRKSRKSVKKSKKSVKKSKKSRRKSRKFGNNVQQLQCNNLMWDLENLDNHLNNGGEISKKEVENLASMLSMCIKNGLIDSYKYVPMSFSQIMQQYGFDKKYGFNERKRTIIERLTKHQKEPSYNILDSPVSSRSKSSSPTKNARNIFNSFGNSNSGDYTALGYPPVLKATSYQNCWE